MDMFPTKILLATDGSEDAVRASRAAVELAGKTGSELHVVLVGGTELEAFSRGDIEAGRMREEAQRTLDEEVGRIEGDGGTVADSYLRTGDVARNVVLLGEDLGVGLIVIGSRGLRALRRAVMGSASEKVVRYAHCPVMVVRKEDE